MAVIPEAEWKALAGELTVCGGTALLLGAVDSGKSTLAKYLVEELLWRGIRVSLVDSDIGQSSLGLPGTICMKVFNKPEDINIFKPERIFFVGVLNPAKRVSAMIEGTRRMVDISEAEGVKTVLVDTTGLISGEVGLALKIGKIRAVRPERIIALQRHDELEQLLSLVGDVHVHRLQVSRFARKRSREERIKYREEKFREYFDKSRLVEIPPGRVEFVRNGNGGAIDVRKVESGTLTGINHDEDTLALGIIEGLTPEEVLIRTPLKSLRVINRIVVGDILYTQEM